MSSGFDPQQPQQEFAQTLKDSIDSIMESYTAILAASKVSFCFNGGSPAFVTDIGADREEGHGGEREAATLYAYVDISKFFGFLETKRRILFSR